MKTMTTMASLATVLTLVSLAAADPREYVNATGDILLVCDDTGATISEGGVCWPGDHISPDANSQATLSINDDATNPTSGFYCQDLNADSICGDGDVGEPAIAFCDSVTVTAGTDWTTSAAVIVFIDGAVFGNPVVSPCAALSVGTHGFVVHS